jgi:dihydrofolate reductase
VCQAGQPLKFGRRTYEIFAGYWGVMPDPENYPIPEPLNTRPEYVASTTLTNPQLADTTVLSGDVAAAIGESRATPSGVTIQVYAPAGRPQYLAATGRPEHVT